MTEALPPTRVVTLTLAPTIDLATTTDIVAPTHKLRCAAVTEQPGGGGVNVARVATRLGIESLAIIPSGGTTGARLVELLHEEDVATSAVATSAATRQSFSVTESATGDQYRFVVAAPRISDVEFDLVLGATKDACRDAGCLVVSGQIPDGLEDRLFVALRAVGSTVPVVVDTSGSALGLALHCGATVVKPSARELGTIVGRDLVTEQEVLDAARNVLASSDVESLVVSIGAGGAFALDSTGRARRFRAPSVRVMSAIGAGDSMVAGIAVAISRGDDIDAALVLGIAAGTATVLTPGSDLCDPVTVERLRPQVTIEHIAS